MTDLAMAAGPRRSEDELAHDLLGELIRHVLELPQNYQVAPGDARLLLAYTDASHRIGYMTAAGKPVARLGGILGKVGDRLRAADPTVPPITSIVVSKRGQLKGLPSGGFDHFVPDWNELTIAQKHERALQLWQLVVDYGPRWADLRDRLDLDVGSMDRRKSRSPLAFGFVPTVLDQDGPFDERINFGAWRNRNWPATRIQEGDTIFFGEKETRRWKWTAVVTHQIAEKYASKEELKNKLNSFFQSDRPSEDPYLATRPETGWYLAFRIGSAAEIDEPLPARINRDGWLGAEEMAALVGARAEDEAVARQVEGGRTLPVVISGLDPKRQERIVKMLVRRDGPFVRAVKRAYNHRCQWVGCHAVIPTRRGPPYVEVAHIEAVSNRGQSVWTNVVCVCPNHHKELDRCGRKWVEHRDGELALTLESHGKTHAAKIRTLSKRELEALLVRPATNEESA